MGTIGNTYSQVKILLRVFKSITTAQVQKWDTLRQFSVTIPIFIIGTDRVINKLWEIGLNYEELFRKPI